MADAVQGACDIFMNKTTLALWSLGSSGGRQTRNIDHNKKLSYVAFKEVMAVEWKKERVESWVKEIESFKGIGNSSTDGGRLLH